MATPRAIPIVSQCRSQASEKVASDASFKRYAKRAPRCAPPMSLCRRSGSGVLVGERSILCRVILYLKKCETRCSTLWFQRKTVEPRIWETFMTLPINKRSAACAETLTGTGSWLHVSPLSRRPGLFRRNVTSPGPLLIMKVSPPFAQS